MCVMHSFSICWFVILNVFSEGHACLVWQRCAERETLVHVSWPHCSQKLASLTLAHGRLRTLLQEDTLVAQHLSKPSNRSWSNQPLISLLTSQVSREKVTQHPHLVSLNGSLAEASKASTRVCYWLQLKQRVKRLRWVIISEAEVMILNWKMLLSDGWIASCGLVETETDHSIGCNAERKCKVNLHSSPQLFPQLQVLTERMRVQTQAAGLSAGFAALVEAYWYKECTHNATQILLLFKASYYSEKKTWLHDWHVCSQPWCFFKSIHIVVDGHDVCPLYIKNTWYTHVHTGHHSLFIQLSYL